MRNGGEGELLAPQKDGLSSAEPKGIFRTEKAILDFIQLLSRTCGEANRIIAGNCDTEEDERTRLTSLADHVKAEISQGPKSWIASNSATDLSGLRTHLTYEATFHECLLTLSPLLNMGKQPYWRIGNWLIKCVTCGPEMLLKRRFANPSRKRACLAGECALKFERKMLRLLDRIEQLKTDAHEDSKMPKKRQIRVLLNFARFLGAIYKSYKPGP